MFIYPALSGHSCGDRGYAVIDLETTGFDAYGSDRVVEVAIVRIDAAGHTLGTFSTLINPERRVGAGAVHHIDDVMVRDAPSFAEIAPSILAWLDGTVIVAHNAAFEDSFLSAEFTRAGWRVPRVPALDTLPMAQGCVPAKNHRLPTLCQWAGILIDQPHTALGDAQATARLLPVLLARQRHPPLWPVRPPALGGSLSGRYRPRASLTSAPS